MRMFMEYETLEVQRRLPKFAGQFGVPVAELARIFNEWLPYIRVVQLPPALRDLDQRALDPGGSVLPPGQRLDPVMQQRLVALDHGDVVRFLLPGQPGQVRPRLVQGIEGHHGPGQVQRFQRGGEVAGLVVLDVDLQVIQERAAMLGRTEKLHPGAIGAAGPAGGLAIDGHGP
jgi:hypothetical protein